MGITSLPVRYNACVAAHKVQVEVTRDIDLDFLEYKDFLTFSSPEPLAHFVCFV